MAEETCTLLPGVFGILVQCFLFAASIAVLVFKKLREKSDRTWNVFLLDGSKQIIGAGFVHFLNMLAAIVLGDELVGDPCDWYWMNIVVDTTFGVFLEYVWLMALTLLLTRFLGDVAVVRFGEYTDKFGTIDRVVYAKQLGLWLCCISGMKVIVVLLLILCANQLFFVSQLILMLVSWNSQVKLIFVMVLTPICMNSLQFWITDNFLQKGGVSVRECSRGCYGYCTGCCHWVYCKITGKEMHGEDHDYDRRRHSSRMSTSREEDDHGGHRHSVPASRTPQRSGRSSLRALVEPLLASDAQHDRFEEERAAYVDQLEQMRVLLEEYSTAAETARREKEAAKAMAKRSQDEMLDAQEHLHRVQQDIRLQGEREELLRSHLSIKEERERQLTLRVRQLEYSYSSAGAAANAVFVAEVSAATVAAHSASNAANASAWRVPLAIGDSAMLTCSVAAAERAVIDCEATSIMDEFVATSSKAPSACAPTPTRPPVEEPSPLRDLVHALRIDMHNRVGQEPM